MLRFLLVVQTLSLAMAFADEVVDPGLVHVRIQAISAQQAALTEKEWKELVEGSLHQTTEVKEAALFALSSRLIGVATPEVVRENRDHFLALLDAETEDVRNQSLAVLETFRPVGDEKIAAAAENAIKTTTDIKFLEIALGIIAELNPPSAEQLKLIASFLKHPDTGVRRIAASCLSEKVDGKLVVLPELLDALKNGKDRNVVGFIAEAVSNIGPEAKEAVPTLLSLAVDHPSLNVRHYSLIALRKIASEDPKAKEVIEKGKQDPSSYVKAAAKLSFRRLDEIHEGKKSKRKSAPQG